MRSYRRQTRRSGAGALRCALAQFREVIDLHTQQAGSRRVADHLGIQGREHEIDKGWAEPADRVEVSSCLLAISRLPCAARAAMWSSTSSTVAWDASRSRATRTAAAFGVTPYRRARSSTDSSNSPAARLKSATKDRRGISTLPANSSSHCSVTDVGSSPTRARSRCPSS